MRSQKQSRSRRSRKSGGQCGAAPWGSQVFGGPGQQVVDQRTGAIQMRSVGGKKSKQQQQQQQQQQNQGGSGLVDVAVPAMLLYANTVYKPRRGKSTHRSRKFRKSRRSSSRRR